MSQPITLRLKVLKLTAAAPHRYRIRRAISQGVSLAILVLVPLTGLARIDFWQGHHYVLGHPAKLKPALAGVIAGIASLYVVTFLSNVVAGRLFCGWGCPVGQVSRFGDAIDAPGLKPRQRLLAYLRWGLFSTVFVGATLCWWVDPRVLVLGSRSALITTWIILVIGLGGAFVHARWWRWEFCKSVCPIGVYYSFVAPAKYFGVHFRNEQRTCIECDACDNVCPVGLTPRDLIKPITNRSGLSIMDAPGHNHCLECGDCIVACERMVTLKAQKRKAPEGSTAAVPKVRAPLHLGWYTGDQRGRAGVIAPSTPAADEPEQGA